MNSGAFDEAAFDFLVSDEGGANVAADRARSAAKAAGAEPARDRIDASVNVQHRLDEVRAAANPLLEAATPLLRMLADMPATLDTSEAVASLRTLLVREVALFQNLCEKADLPWKHMAVVRYCLCTALDEAANRTRWGGGGVWASQSLLITYEGEVDGGEKFFLLIGRMATDPQEYVDILEILYRVLGLGFEGRYSVVADGRRHLEQIRQRLWTLITGARDAIQPELSLRWRGAEPGRLPLLRSVPAWASGALVFLLLFGLFAFYQYRLLTERNALEARILAIAKDEPAPPPQRLRLSILLKNEIARGLLTVDEDDRRSVVVFRGDSMFRSGESRVLPEIEPVLDKVAREVARVGGRVTVTGHSDNQPIRRATSRTTSCCRKNARLTSRKSWSSEALRPIVFARRAGATRSPSRKTRRLLADPATAASKSRSRCNAGVRHVLPETLLEIRLFVADARMHRGAACLRRRMVRRPPARVRRVAAARGRRRAGRRHRPSRGAPCVLAVALAAQPDRRRRTVSADLARGAALRVRRSPPVRARVGPRADRRRDALLLRRVWSLSPVAGGSDERRIAQAHSRAVGGQAGRGGPGEHPCGERGGVEGDRSTEALARRCVRLAALARKRALPV